MICVMLMVRICVMCVVLDIFLFGADGKVPQMSQLNVATNWVLKCNHDRAAMSISCNFFLHSKERPYTQKAGF